MKMPSYWLLPFLLAALPGQSSPAVPPAPPAAAAEKLPKLRVIGASVSGGFKDGPLTGAQEVGDTVALQRVLQRWADEQAEVSTHNLTKMLAMFTNPDKLGAEQIAGVAQQQPDLVVAVDFLFWFAYGYVQGEEASARRERFQRGLQLLASLEQPLVVGDLPDMTGAAQRMLNPRQIPPLALQQALNEELREFAAKRPNWTVLPLADLVRQMREAGATLPLRAGPLPTPPGALLQGDRLHANRLGMAYLGHALQPLLQQALPASHPLRERQWDFEHFVAAVEAESELAALRERQPVVETAPAAGGSGSGGSGR